MELSRIQRIRAYDEGTGSANFATDRSSAIASFVDVLHNNAECKIDVEMLDNEQTNTYPHENRFAYLGKRAGTLSMEFDLRSTGTALTSGATPPASPDWHPGYLLSPALGFDDADAGSTEASGGASTTTSMIVSTGHGSRFAAGGCYGFVKANGYVECREIDSISTDTLTPKVTMSEAPPNTCIVYNSVMIVPGDDADNSLQFAIEGDERDDIWWLRGAQCSSLSINMEIGKLIRCKMDWSAADYRHDDDVGTPLGSGNLAQPTETGSQPIVFLNSEVLLTSGSQPQTRTEIDPTDIAISITRDLQPVPAPNGVNGVRRWFVVPGRDAVTVELTIPVSGSNIATYEDGMLARTAYSLWIQCGRSAPGIFCFSLPYAQIRSIERVDKSGFRAIKIKLVGDIDRNLASFGWQGYRAPYRMFFL